MNTILDLVIMNNQWNLWDLANLKCVDRACKTIVDDHMEYESKKLFDEMNKSPGKELFCERTKSKTPCQKCGEKTSTIYPFSHGKKHCTDCREMYQITKTEAKNVYKLTDKDLEKLDFSSSVHFLYGTRITYFSRKQVICYSLLKHGAIPKKRTYSNSNAKEKREVQVSLLQEKYPFANQTSMQFTFQISQYIRNGRGGIRKLEEAMKAIVIK